MFRTIQDVIDWYKTGANKERMKMTNKSALGYMIVAAKRAGLHDEFIQRLVRLMCAAMDEKTEEEAEQAYNNF